MVRNILGIAPTRTLRDRSHEGLGRSGTAGRSAWGSSLPRTAQLQGRCSRRAGAGGLQALTPWRRALAGAAGELLIASATAEAVRADRLVSNIAKALSAVSTLNSSDRAQPFTIGSNTSSYTFASIGLRLRRGRLSGPPSTSPTCNSPAGFHCPVRSPFRALLPN